MDEQVLIGEMIRSNVIREGSKGEVTVDDSALNEIEAIQGFPEKLEGSDSAVVERFGRDAVAESDFVAQSIALERRLPDLTTDELLKASLVFSHLRYDSPDKGTPEGFLPLPGHHLSAAIRVVERCLVYVWKHECDPCDSMRKRLETGHDSHQGQLALFSVFGPAQATALGDAFDVNGAPTILFVSDGEVQSRLIGKHPYSTVENEIKLLVDR